MSHLVATSIVLTKNEIIVKGGSNNVVPREKSTIRVQRTPENMRIFVRDLLGGCIKANVSANDYFWWWLMRRGFWSYFDWSKSTDADWDRCARLVSEEYDRRKKHKQYTVHEVNAEGRHTGFFVKRGTTHYLLQTPQRMSFYQAVYEYHYLSPLWQGTGKKVAVAELQSIS